MTIKNSRYPYLETVTLLKEKMTEGGNTIFACIDQAAAAAGVGLSLRPTTLLIFGNPKAGTALMDAVPLSGLDLPLKLLVWEEAGKVSVAYVPMAEIARRYDVTGMDARIESIDHALDTLTNSV